MNTWHEPDEMVLEPMKYLNRIPERTQIRSDRRFGVFADRDKVEAIKVDHWVSRTTPVCSLTILKTIPRLGVGMPVAHSIFGVPSTINCANYVYFLALSKIMVL